MLFSTLILGVSTHLSPSAANLTQSMLLSRELMFVVRALFLSPRSAFCLVQCNLSSFLLRKETSALTPSTGTHILKKIKDTSKEIERDHMFMY